LRKIGEKFTTGEGKEATKGKTRRLRGVTKARGLGGNRERLGGSKQFDPRKGPSDSHAKGTRKGSKKNSTKKRLAQRNRLQGGGGVVAIGKALKKILPSIDEGVDRGPCKEGRGRKGTQTSQKESWNQKGVMSTNSIK